MSPQIIDHVPGVTRTADRRPDSAARPASSFAGLAAIAHRVGGA